MGAQLPRLWNHPAAAAATRKRILRTVLEEIVVTVEPGQLLLKLHWNGGDHTALAVLKNRVGQHRWKTSPAIEQLIGDLARVAPDQSIAAILNRLGMRKHENLYARRPIIVVRNRTVLGAESFLGLRGCSRLRTRTKNLATRSDATSAFDDGFLGIDQIIGP